MTETVLTEETVGTAPQQSARLPIVAIVGRPNAGKSTLFNRLLRQQKAIVDNTPGVTRDRNFAQATWRKRPFLLIDTGGIDFQEDGTLAGRVQEQTRLAINEADVIIFLFDGREGLNPADAEAVDLLRRRQKPIFFVVNKIDGEKQEAAATEFFALGLEPLFTISAAHGRGVNDLMQAVSLSWTQDKENAQPQSSAPSAHDSEPKELHLAIVGRPNAGKSSLLNCLVGYERSIVDATPGTTRDAVDSVIEWQGQPLVLVDTAGARRRSKVHERIEQASVWRALKALERAELGIIVVDAVQGLADQDIRLIRYAWDRGRALVLVLNKWDAMPPERKNQKRYLEDLQQLSPITTTLPVVFLSALTGSRVNKLLPIVMQTAKAHALQIPTPQLNRAFQDWTRRTPPPSYKGKAVKIFYVAQTGTKPPQFAIFTSVPEGITPAYARYLENQFRATFDVLGTPVRFSFRRRRNEEPAR
ncbi:MAG: ribosome biogenesis GTPase Der [Candidatus Binatia bacterium]